MEYGTQCGMREKILYWSFSILPLKRILSRDPQNPCVIPVAKIMMKIGDLNIRGNILQLKTKIIEPFRMYL